MSAAIQSKWMYLKFLFEGCGFTDVETFIASGNVIFDSPYADDQKITQTIESYLKDKAWLPGGYIREDR